MMKNWIYHHSTGFLNYTSVLLNSAILLGSAKCSTKILFKLLICILSAVKTGLQSYCDSSYSRGGVNQIWILKNSYSFIFIKTCREFQISKNGNRKSKDVKYNGQQIKYKNICYSPKSTTQKMKDWVTQNPSQTGAVRKSKQ